MFAAVDTTSSLLELNGTFLVEVIVFLVMLGVLAKWAYPPIIRAAEARSKQIEAGVRAAQESEKRLNEVKAEVEKILDDARGQAREILDRARREASLEQAEARAKARTEAQAILDKAKADIAVERDRALQDLRNQVATLVVATAGKVLGQSIDEKAHQRLIEESLAKITPEPGGRG
jgi:F-type H+-transporting ATPase subunit b